jgi:hypothetical protein
MYASDWLNLRLEGQSGIKSTVSLVHGLNIWLTRAATKGAWTVNGRCRGISRRWRAEAGYGRSNWFLSLSFVVFPAKAGNHFEPPRGRMNGFPRSRE